jgi:hypothetical protein
MAQAYAKKLLSNRLTTEVFAETKEFVGTNKTING